MNSVDILFDQINEGRKGNNIGLSTGLSKIDQYIGGIQKKIYTLIFGLSGSGKSAFTLYAYVYRPLKDYPDKDFVITYYSLELSETLLLAKLLCLYIYEEYGKIIPYKKLMSWQEILSDEDYEYIIKGREWLNSILNKLIIFDKSLNAASFYASLHSILEEYGSFEESDKRIIYKPTNPNKLILCIIDHIGLCKPSSGNSKKQEIDAISAYAVRFRERCSVSFIIIQQQNRNSSDMDRRKADLLECSEEDLKDLTIFNNKIYWTNKL